VSHYKQAIAVKQNATRSGDFTILFSFPTHFSNMFRTFGWRYGGNATPWGKSSLFAMRKISHAEVRMKITYPLYHFPMRYRDQGAAALKHFLRNGTVCRPLSSKGTQKNNSPSH
jgi:hypothetical protein